MNDINLLKDFYRPKKTAKLALYMLIGAVAVSLFSYFGIVIPLREKHELSLMVSHISQINGQYESVEKEYEELSKRMGELRKKASGIAPLISVQRWSQIFTLIEGAVPQSVVLHSISYDGDVVTLEGNAADDIEIARFMVKLENTGLFSNVSLKRIEGEQDGPMFLITCKFNSQNRAAK